jgi:hypothetical protein
MELSPSLGIQGWSSTSVLDYEVIAVEKQARERQQCWSFNDDSDQSIEHQNIQVLRLIAALGEKHAGRVAIVKALAGKQGMAMDEAESLAEGHSDQRLRVPSYMRDTLREIGLGDTLAPLNVMEVVGGATEVLVADDAWHDLEFEVALDSGAVVHVCSLEDCPGYMLQDSPGSKAGQKFLMGDGGTIPNLGQKALNLTDEKVDRNMNSIFQIAAVTRPLMSVGKICDEGHNITFDATKAIVREENGNEICRFERSHGGLYVAKMKLRNPAGFGRPE